VIAAIVVLGMALGYGTGRYLWAQRHRVLAPFPVIAILVLAGLLTLRLFDAVGQDLLWHAAFFPLLVGWGAGLAVTPARLPARSPWWQLWRQ
jgi:hypothetical protein